jgi:polyisoprenoid-binding protein YceI
MVTFKLNVLAKQTLIVLALLLFSNSTKAQLYITQSGIVSFFSATAMENIDATNKQVKTILNSKGELVFLIANTEFIFPNKLMQEHFNEKYIESEKYPQSSFKGKINESFDLTKPGEYNVTATGKLNIHGVEQERTINGKIVVTDKDVQLVAIFIVKLTDHHIKIPKLIMAKIAEAVEVKVNCTLLPKSK